MTIDYSKEIIDAVETIVDAKLNQIKFDITEICTIVSKSEEDENIYWVTNGQLTFQARSSDGRQYRNGAKVYVTIPQGDYSLEKIIVNADYSTETVSKNYIQTSPFEHFVPAYNFTLNQDIALSPEESTVEIVGYDTKSLIFPNDFGTPNAFGLSFGASTSGKIDAKGDFKIKINFLNSKDTLILPDKDLIVYNSKYMYGNPYEMSDSIIHQYLFTFPVVYEDEVSKFELSDYTQIKKVIFTLEYDENSFEEIEINQIQFYLGYTGLDSEDKVCLNTNRALEYNGTPVDVPLYVNWYDSNANKIYNMQNKTFDAENYKIYLFQYVAPYTKQLDGNALGLPDFEESGIYWRTIADLTNDLYYYVDLLTSIKSDQYKVGIIGKDGTYLESNGISFLKEDYAVEGKYEIENMVLSLDSGDDGIYNDYGLDNKRISDITAIHQVTGSFIDTLTWKSSKIDRVEWRLPYVATMIDVVTETIQNEEDFTIQPIDPWEKQVYEDPDTKQKYWRSVVTRNDAYYNQYGFPSSISFARKNQFDYSRTNNVVECFIELDDGQKYYGKITLQFGSQGTSGSAYSFNIYPSRKGGILYSDPDRNDSITFTARLETNTGEEVPIDYDTSIITWYYMCGDVENKTPIATNTTSLLLTYNDLNDGQSDVTNKQIEISDGTTTLKVFSYYLILCAKITSITTDSGQSIDLTAYYPIARTANSKYFIEGTTRVVYGSFGSAPSGIRFEPYKLYEETDAGIVEITNVQWRLENRYGNQKNSLNPQIALDTDKLVLRAADRLNTNIDQYVLKAYQQVGGSEALLYYQPILIIQNTYVNDTMNKWGGNTSVDEESNYIFSAMIGAGGKNTNNEFSGVLMGKVSISNVNAGLPVTGLYGFKDGALRYRLDENGEFYVGTGDNNKISFDDEGMIIKTDKFALTSGVLDLHSDSNKVNKIAGWEINEHRLQSAKKINNNTVYCPFMQTTSKEGDAVLDIAAFGIEITEKKDDETITTTPFQVSYDGTITANNAIITGGTIGGWTLGTIKGHKILYAPPVGNKPGTGMAVSSSENDPAFYAGFKGDNTPWNYSGWQNATKFYVTQKGDLVAQSAKITGSLEAGSSLLGTELGGVTIGNASNRGTITLWTPNQTNIQIKFISGTDIYYKETDQVASYYGGEVHLTMGIAEKVGSTQRSPCIVISATGGMGSGVFGIFNGVTYYGYGQ